MAQQLDPSHNVPGELIPHIHLISSFRYPAIARLDLNEVAKWLMAAPQIARDKAPFFWGYLDKPADGTILQTWQPLQRLGTNFATDGFVWSPPEQIYKHDLGNGAIMEIYYLKAGYIPGEQVAAHARRRFRLVPAPGHANAPPIDQNLFIVHYGPSEPNDRMPINAIPYDERVAAIMQQRGYLLSRGMLRRKDFMLSDRANWPSLPELTRQQMGAQQNPRGVPPQMAYPPQPVAGPPAKRARHGQNQGQQAAMPGMPAIDTMDDEEDISRGDMFDHLTPRELSLGRYQQNHEWMEEILSSPYRMGQIAPADLGLGLKGELASLTEGIFAAQGGDAYSQLPQKTYVGKLEPGQADEFRSRVNEYISTSEAEIAQMKKEQEEKLAQFKQGSFIRTKERELRCLAEQTGPEAWRVEGRVDATDNDDDHPRTTSKQSLAEIVQQVEASLGRKIESKPVLKRVQEGGYQLPAPEPEPVPQPEPQTGLDESAGQKMSQQPSQGSQNSGLGVGDEDMDMGDTASGLLDQMHTGLSSASTPADFPAQAHLSTGLSTAATPANMNVASPALAQPADTTMGEADAIKQEQPGAAAEADGDWVVVPKGGTATDPNVGAAPDAKPQPDDANKLPGAAKASAEATPAGSNSFDQNDFSSLGDLDTAGDALSGFDAPEMDGAAGGLGEDLDLNMDMEDSAFGDAFHGVGATGTPGEGPE